MINNSLLNKDTLKALKKAGWFSGRQKNISEWIKQLRDEGFKEFPYAIQILTELGGLYIEPDKIKNRKFYPEPFDYHALNAGSGEYDRLEFLEPIAGENLYPLGMAFDHMFMYVGLSKKIYLGDMGRLFLLADNIEESLNNLVLGIHEPIELGKPGTV